MVHPLSKILIPFALNSGIGVRHVRLTYRTFIVMGITLESSDKLVRNLETGFCVGNRGSGGLNIAEIFCLSPCSRDERSKLMNIQTSEI